MKTLITILAIILVALLVVMMFMSQTINNTENNETTNSGMNIFEIAGALLFVGFLIKVVPIAIVIIIIYFVLKWATKKTCNYLADRIAEKIKQNNEELARQIAYELQQGYYSTKNTEE